MSKTNIHVEKGKLYHGAITYEQTSDAFKRHCERCLYEKGFDRNGRNTVMKSDLEKDFRMEVSSWGFVWDIEEDITHWLSNPPKRSKGKYGQLYDYDSNFKKEIVL